MPEETNSGHESRIRPGHVGSGPAGSPAGFCGVCVFLSVLSFCQVGQAVSRSARNRSGRSDQGGEQCEAWCYRRRTKEVVRKCVASVTPASGKGQSHPDERQAMGASSMKVGLCTRLYGVRGCTACTILSHRTVHPLPHPTPEHPPQSRVLEGTCLD